MAVGAPERFTCGWVRPSAAARAHRAGGGTNLGLTTVLAASYDTAALGELRKPKMTAMKRDFWAGFVRHTLRANSMIAS